MRTLGLALLTLLGCKRDGGEPTTDGGATDVTGTGGATNATDGMSSQPTGGSGGASHTDGTTGGAGDAIEVCLDYCAHNKECHPLGDDDCANECPLEIAIYNYPGPECLAVHVAYLKCFIAATCDAIDAIPPACSAEEEAQYSEACTSDVCLAHADHLIECGLYAQDDRIPAAVECTFGVATALEAGQVCLDATEALYACIAEAPCEQIESGMVCQDKEDAQIMLCGG